MSTTRARRAKEVFERALDALPPDREAVVAAACGDDAALLAEVNALLAAEAQMGDFLAASGAELLLGAAADRRLAPGERVAGYTITGVLGEGGAGVVYEAEQEEPRRAVALKLMRGRSLGGGSLARFRQEAADLARLRHPAIAHVYAAGTFDSGGRARPWIAMERVEGARSVTAFARERSLGAASRVALVADVGDAVHHAHQRGVVHRDLTPGNVLVDADGRPKVVDFGVACAAAGGPAEAAGTPDYASPEQLDGEGGADVRADVYGLGALLFELLCGRPPHETGDLPLGEIARRKRAGPPPAPSSLAAGLPRDLDAIVVKALAPDREARYASAAAFCDDLRRFLAGEPVAAHRGGAAYHVVKFVRRRRGIAAAVAAAALALVVGAVVSVSYAVENARARAEAERSSYVANVSAAAAALRVDDAGEARRRLALAPPALRDWEWRHLRSRTDVSVSSREATPGEIWSGAASRDGTVVAFGATTSRLATAAVLRADGTRDVEWTAPGTAPQVALSPDGRRFAAGFRTGAVRTRDRATGEERTAERAHDGAVIDLAYSPDGTLLATAGADGAVVVRDAATLAPRISCARQPDRVISVAWDAAGRRLATGCRDGVIRLFDAASGAQVAELAGHAGSVESVAFGEGARLVSASRDHTVRFWDLATGACIAVGNVHGSNVREVAFDPSGRTAASASWDGTVRLWDGATGEERGILRGHSGPVAGLAFAEGDAPVISFSWDGTIRRFDPRHPEVPAFGDFQDRVTGLAFDADGERLAVCCADGTVVVLDGRTAEPLFRARARSALRSIRFQAQGTEAVVRANLGASFASSGGATDLLALHSEIALAPDCASAWCGRRPDDGPATDLVRIDIASIRDLASTHLPGRLAAVTADFARGFVLVGSEEGDVTRWTGAGAVSTRSCGGGCIYRLVASADGERVLACCNDGSARILRTSDLSEVVALRGHAGALSDAAFLPGGRRVVTTSRDGTVRIWDAASAECLLVLHGHGYPVTCVAVSPDGTRIATGAGSPEDAHSNVKIWIAPEER